MLGIILGVFTIILGMKGFTSAGIPLTKTKNVTGTTAHVIGIITIGLGALFILEGTYGVARLLRF
jgi:hypothetical protein